MSGLLLRGPVLDFDSDEPVELGSCLPPTFIDEVFQGCDRVLLAPRLGVLHDVAPHDGLDVCLQGLVGVRHVVSSP